MNFRKYLSEISISNNFQLNYPVSIRNNKKNIIPDEDVGKHVVVPIDHDLLLLALSPMKKHLQPFPINEIEKIYNNSKNKKEILLNAKEIFLLKNLMNNFINAGRDKEEILWKNITSRAKRFLSDIDIGIQVSGGYKKQMLSDIDNAYQEPEEGDYE